MGKSRNEKFVAFDSEKGNEDRDHYVRNTLNQQHLNITNKEVGKKRTNDSNSHSENAITAFASTTAAASKATAWTTNIGWKGKEKKRKY